METKLSLLSEKNKQLFAESMNEIHDLTLSFDEWMLMIDSLKEMSDFFYGIETQEHVVNN